MSRVSDCDYCGDITVVGSDSNGGEACRSCLASLPEDKRAEHRMLKDIHAAKFRLSRRYLYIRLLQSL